MRTKLTRQLVESAKVTDKPYRIHDTGTPGLHLRVQPSGVKVYYVSYRRNEAMPLGRHPGVTLEQARQAARKALVEATEGGAPVRVRERRERVGRATGEHVVTLGDLLTHRYGPWVKAERKAGAATLQALQAQFGTWSDRKLVDLSPWQLERFKADRLKAGVKPATVNRDLVRIKAALAKAVEWGILPTNPLAKVKRVKHDDTGRVRFLTDAEEKRLRDALGAREERRRKARASGNKWLAARSQDPRPLFSRDGYTDHLMPLTLLALNTGARRGELFGLTWSDVDLERKLLTLRGATSKAGRTRHIPLNAEAHDALKRWRKQSPRDATLVFHGAGGGRMTNVNKSWAELCTAAKLQDFRFHDCRHHFASRLVMAGVDLNTVRELLGHADIAMTLRYAHLAPEHKADAVAKLVRPMGAR